MDSKMLVHVSETLLTQFHLTLAQCHCHDPTHLLTVHPSCRLLFRTFTFMNLAGRWESVVTVVATMQMLGRLNSAFHYSILMVVSHTRRTAHLSWAITNTSALNGHIDTVSRAIILEYHLSISITRVQTIQASNCHPSPIFHFPPIFQRRVNANLIQISR